MNANRKKPKLLGWGFWAFIGFATLLSYANDPRPFQQLFASLLMAGEGLVHDA